MAISWYPGFPGFPVSRLPGHPVTRSPGIPVSRYLGRGSSYVGALAGLWVWVHLLVIGYFNLPFSSSVTCLPAAAARCALLPTPYQTSLLGDLGRVSPGDCIVAFSRREIFEIKRAVEMTTKHRCCVVYGALPPETLPHTHPPLPPCSLHAPHLLLCLFMFSPIQRAVEMTTKHRCCVVYGALPPETRRQQARLFNEEESDFRVLVASDAIGMGLNLSIRRVVFSTLHKFNGEEKIIIPSPMVRTGAHMGGQHSVRQAAGEAVQRGGERLLCARGSLSPQFPSPQILSPQFLSPPSLPPSLSPHSRPLPQITGEADRREGGQEGKPVRGGGGDMPGPHRHAVAHRLLCRSQSSPPRLLAFFLSLNRATKAAATMTTPEGQNVPSLEQSAGVEAGVGTSTSPPTAEGQVAPVVPPAPASGVPEPVAPSPAVPSAYAPAGGDEDDEDDDDGYLSDDSDEGIDVHAKGALAAKARVTLTLLIPFALAKEMPAVKPSVKALLVFLRKGSCRTMLWT
ncbi:unnamed protein product [Closterium sp. NIES-64]|nr:unnamed protein product [Closterium sp. NIES-64]